MAKCKCSKRGASKPCRAKQCKFGCYDVCSNPICGTPGMLSLMAPLIYDEIGVNLCATMTPDPAITTFTNATSACAQLINLNYTVGAATGNVTVSPIPGRSNCYQVTLTNITANVVVNFYDINCVLLGTSVQEVEFLPNLTTAPTYDEDTNPTSVTLEIFAPYGVSYAVPTGGATPSIIINNINFAQGTNYVTQGLNLYAIPKVVNFDVAANSLSVGLSLVLQSLYYAPYHVESAGRVNTPKADLNGDDEGNCIDFVEGDLLDLAIKPLYLGPPFYEEDLKKDCDEQSCCDPCQDNDDVTEEKCPCELE